MWSIKWMCKQIVNKELNYFVEKKFLLGYSVFVKREIQVLANRFLLISVFIISQFDTVA